MYYEYSENIKYIRSSFKTDSKKNSINKVKFFNNFNI